MNTQLRQRSTMLKIRTTDLCHILLILFALTASTCTIAATLTIKQAEQYMSQSFPSAKIDNLKPAAIPGIYEIMIGGTVYYLSEDGTFLFSGSLHNLRTQVNLTEQTYSEMRQNIVHQINPDHTISYAPKDYQYTVNVFSDVNCPYCRKFHNQLDEVQAFGIRVNYILVPYLGPASHKNAVNVWCAKDRHAALERAKQGLPLDQLECDHPIDDNFNLAKLADVKGTPAFLLKDGRLLNGYRQPQDLFEEIKRANAQ